MFDGFHPKLNIINIIIHIYFAKNIKINKLLNFIKLFFQIHICKQYNEYESLSIYQTFLSYKMNLNLVKNIK